MSDEDDRLELVEARCDVETVERLRQSYGEAFDEGNRMSNGERPTNVLTGGNWENRANDYWRNWHNSARIAFAEQMRAEEAERRLEGAVDALKTISAMGEWGAAVSVADTAQTAIQVARVALERHGGSSS
jgi:hypothetical protein